jgi:hypothetical protein
MLVIQDFDQCIDYVSSLGFTAEPGFPGWIIEAQKIMCDTADLLLSASGQNSWYHKYFIPFEVIFNTEDRIFYVLDRSDIYRKVDPQKNKIDYCSTDDLELIDSLL